MNPQVYEVGIIVSFFQRRKPSTETFHHLISISLNVSIFYAVAPDINLWSSFLWIPQQPISSDPVGSTTQNISWIRDCPLLSIASNLVNWPFTLDSWFPSWYYSLDSIQLMVKVVFYFLALPGLNRPWLWKCQILTTRPPGNSKEGFEKCKSDINSSE